jgi:hypothetical protein
MPAGSSCRSLISFTFSPHEGGTVHMLLSRPCSGFATEPPNTGTEFGRETTFKVADQTILHDADHPSRIFLPVIPTPIQTSTKALR